MPKQITVKPFRRKSIFHILFGKLKEYMVELATDLPAARHKGEWQKRSFVKRYEELNILALGPVKNRTDIMHHSTLEFTTMRHRAGFQFTGFKRVGPIL